MTMEPLAPLRALKQWEDSPQDVAHDKGKNFASGGKVRGMGAAKKGGKYSVC